MLKQLLVAAAALMILSGCASREAEPEPRSPLDRYYQGILIPQTLAGSACTDMQMLPKEVWVALRQPDADTRKLTFYVGGESSGTWRGEVNPAEDLSLKEWPMTWAATDLYQLTLERPERGLKLSAALHQPLTGRMADFCIYDQFQIKARLVQPDANNHPTYRYELGQLLFATEREHAEARQEQPQAYTRFLTNEQAVLERMQQGEDWIDGFETLTAEARDLFGEGSANYHRRLSRLRELLMERDGIEEDHRWFKDMTRELKLQARDRFGREGYHTWVYDADWDNLTAPLQERKEPD